MGGGAQPSRFPPIENVLVGVVVYDVMNLLIKFHGFIFFFRQQLAESKPVVWFGELTYFEKVLPGSDPYSSSEVIVSHS
jgi:hypothetical protein